MAEARLQALREKEKQQNAVVRAHQAPPTETELDEPVIRRSDEASSRYG